MLLPLPPFLLYTTVHVLLVTLVNALHSFTLPPDLTLPFKELSVSTFLTTAVLTPKVDRLGYLLFTSAATPATIGAAAEVPLKYA